MNVGSGLVHDPADQLGIPTVDLGGVVVIYSSMTGCSAAAHACRFWSNANRGFMKPLLFLSRCMHGPVCMALATRPRTLYAVCVCSVRLMWPFHNLYLRTHACEICDVCSNNFPMNAAYYSICRDVKSCNMLQPVLSFCRSWASFWALKLHLEGGPGWVGGWGVGQGMWIREGALSTFGGRGVRSVYSGLPAGGYRPRRGGPALLSLWICRGERQGAGCAALHDAVRCHDLGAVALQVGA